MRKKASQTRETFPLHRESRDQIKSTNLIEDRVTFFRIRAFLKEPARGNLFLKENSGIFAKGLENMPGVDPSVIIHRLCVDSDA